MNDDVPSVGMAWEARSGLKRLDSCWRYLPWLRRNGLGSPFGFETPDPTTVALVAAEEEPGPPGSPKKPQMLQVSVQRGGRLLQGRDRQALSLAQMDVVGVVADVAMRTPDGSRDVVEFAMRGQASHFPHKAKRRAGRQPGKPARTLRLKGQQPTSGADHHLMSLSGILHQRYHLRRGRSLRLAAAFGSTPTPPTAVGRLRGHSRQAASRGGRFSEVGELVGEIGQLCLQRSQLGRERAQGHEDLEEVIRQSERLCRGSRLGRLLRQAGQAAMMRGGQPAQLFLRQPVPPRIVRMRLPGERRADQPATQRFGIDAQVPTTVGQRYHSHDATPFIVLLKRTTSDPGLLPGIVPGEVLGFFLGQVQGTLPACSQEEWWQLARHQTPTWMGHPAFRGKRLWCDDDDDTSPPNTGGCAESATSRTPAGPRRAEARSGAPAGAALPRG